MLSNHLENHSKIYFNFYLFPVLSSAAVQTLDEVGGVAQEHGVAGGPGDHGEHGEPHVSEGLRRKPAIPNTQHV